MAKPIFFFNYNIFKRIDWCIKEEMRLRLFSSRNIESGVAATSSLKSVIIVEENGLKSVLIEEENSLKSVIIEEENGLKSVLR